MTNKAPKKQDHLLWPKYVDFCLDWQMANAHAAIMGEDGRDTPSFEEWLKMQEEKVA